MFSPIENCRWWGKRLQAIRYLVKHQRGNTRQVQRIAMENYRDVLVAGFTVLFNTRLKDRGNCI